jgi:DNA replication protein DnaC
METYRDWIDHPFVSRVSKALEQGRGCLLIGPSSSGKSVLASQVGRSFLLGGQSVYYLNLSNVKGFPSGLLKKFLIKEQVGKPFLLVADDLQSNPSATRYLLAVASAARRICDFQTLLILAISWPDFSEEAVKWFEDCLPFAVRPHQIRNKLIQKYYDVISARDIKEISERFGEDMFLLHLSLNLSKDLGKCVDLIEVAEEVWRKKTMGIKISNNITVRIILITGSLGQYDISISEKFLQHEAQVDPDSVEETLRIKLLRRKGDNLTLGHRSLCSLLVDLLSIWKGWEELRQLKGPKDIVNVVLDYLKSLGSSLAVDSLRALYESAGFREMPQLNRRAATIVEIWQTFNALVERIEQQQQIDFTWGNTPSSAMFAIEAFNEIGSPRLSKGSLDFLRSHWKVKKDEIKVSIEGFKTKGDFVQIQKSMIEEDQIEEDKLPSFWIPANEVDIDRFHKTWVLGLLLCAEASAESPKLPLNEFASLVEKQQLESGAFYPARVPWCTARVLIGLSACGRTFDTSNCVKKAVNWLLRDEKEGGANINGVWRSGTGKWNSTVETTGMVLLALSSVGYDCSDKRLLPARALMLDNLDKWRAGEELDGALSIQAYLDTGGNWEDVAHYAQQLSKWARGEAFWRGARLSATESLQQSCRVAQIASHLIHIGWTAIRSDLPAFLEALAPPDTLRIVSETEKVTRDKFLPREEILIKESRKGKLDPILQSLKQLDRLYLSEYSVVERYQRYDERVRNELRNWRLRISNALLNPQKAHDNFLIWSPPGSGKTFFIQEIARSLKKDIKYIELNIARQSREEFIRALTEVKESKLPTLCLIDEVDARASESWTYEEFFSLLDINLSSDRATVFILIGSLSTGMQGMIKNITTSVLSHK